MSRSAIERIPYPSAVGPYLQQRDTEAPYYNADEFDEFLEQGQFPSAPRVPSDLKYAYLLFLLVDMLNEVIDSFDILIADMDDLPLLAPALNGKASKRIELLIRTFYSEFYRGQEVTKKIVGQLRRDGYLSRAAVKSVVQAIDESTSQIVRMRHSFAHGEAGIVGRSYNLLRIFEVDASRASSEVRAATGKSLHLSDVASPACRERADAMHYVARYFQVLFRTIVEILAGEHGQLDQASK